MCATASNVKPHIACSFCYDDLAANMTLPIFALHHEATSWCSKLLIEQVASWQPSQGPQRAVTAAAASAAAVNAPLCKS
jgi:hypothetical protein